MNTRRKLAPVCIMVLLVTSLVPASVQANDTPSVQITTHWVGDGLTDTAHAYLLTFSDNGSYGFDVDMIHMRNETPLPSTHTLAWDSMNGFRTALLEFNTSLVWGDSIDLTITITDHDAVSGLSIDTTRAFTVGQWNQPMDDHEAVSYTHLRAHET